MLQCRILSPYPHENHNVKDDVFDFPETKTFQMSFVVDSGSFPFMPPPGAVSSGRVFADSPTAIALRKAAWACRVCNGELESQNHQSQLFATTLSKKVRNDFK